MAVMDCWVVTPTYNYCPEAVASTEEIAKQIAKDLKRQNGTSFSIYKTALYLSIQAYESSKTHVLKLSSEL